MNRSEHIEWSKERAKEILDKGDYVGAIASMISDMNKHDETESVMEIMSPIGMMEAMNGDINSVRRYIDGFS